MDADDERLAAMERQGRFVGLVIVELVLGLSMAGAVMVMLTTAPILYESASRVRNHGLVATPFLTALFILLLRRAGLPRALLATGGLLFLTALVLGVLPPGQRAERCPSVLGDFWGGPGANAETCFDLRQVQKYDVASTVGVGLLLAGAGAAFAGFRPRAGGDHLAHSRAAAGLRPPG